jgi:putative DNA primase/helicase|tara:strand:+ start:558 stop:1871 length:1314 start_codon:yes stop_codon:yes gene_type:complete
VSPQNPPLAVLPPTKSALELRVSQELPRAQFRVWDRLAKSATKYDSKSGQITKLGAIHRSLVNIVLILEADTRWAGRVKLNTLKRAIELDGESLRDSDEWGLICWLSQHYGVDFSSVSMIHGALLQVSSCHEYQPVQDYLEGLEWDGVERVERWLSTYLGVANAPLMWAIGRCFMISMVARAYATLPDGVKVDTCLILVGGQGVGKSQALATLAGRSWFSDSPINLRDSTAAMGQIAGVWLYEFAELDAVRASEVTATKAFISQQVDKYRVPYGKNQEAFARQGVLAGTTNNEDGGFLNDSTGSRRFWPVTVGWVDLDALEEDRDQLWAEAVALYDGGAQWWLDDEESTQLAEDGAHYSSEDIWTAPIMDYLEGPPRVLQTTTIDVLRSAVGMDTDKAHAGHQRRVSAVLRQLGWVQRRALTATGYQRVWIDPDRTD